MSTGACQAVHWTGHCLLRPALPQQCGLLITAGLDWRISCKRRVLVRRLKKAMLGEARNSLEQRRRSLACAVHSRLRFHSSLNCLSHLALKNLQLALLEAQSKLNSKLIGPVSVFALRLNTPPAALVELLSIRSASKMQRYRAPSPQTLCP